VQESFAKATDATFVAVPQEPFWVALGGPVICAAHKSFYAAAEQEPFINTAQKQFVAATQETFIACLLSKNHL